VNEVYHPLTDTWTTKTSMPAAREFLCANVVGGKIYLIGGSKPVNLNNPSYVPNVNEVYDPETDSWTTEMPSPTQVSAYASAVCDKRTYLFSESLTQIFDPQTCSWSRGAPIPRTEWGAAAGVTSGVFAPKRIYVLGGYPTFNYNQIYDPETDTWTTGAQMPTNRYGLGVAVVSDAIYAIGGGRAANEKYTPVGYGVTDSSSSPSPSQEPTSTSEQQMEPFPTTLVVASVVSVVVIGVGLLVHFKKRHAKSGGKA